MDLIHGSTRYSKCWSVFKIVFTLSHGQAAVERRFSVNKELFVENLQQISLISQRLICDYFADFLKPISEILLTNKMVKSFWLSHSRYIAALERKRNATVSQEKNLKQKLKLEEIAEVKEKRALEAAINSLETSIEEYSIQGFPYWEDGWGFPSNQLKICSSPHLEKSLPPHPPVDSPAPKF